MKKGLRFCKTELLIPAVTALKADGWFLSITFHKNAQKKLEFYLHFISIGFIASSISDSDYYFCLIVVAVPKGIVHPNTNKQTFIHRSLVQNLFDFVSTFEHRGRCFEECWTHGL